MKKISLFLSSAILVLIWFVWAANPTIINHSYDVDGDNVTIFWTNNSNWWNVDINVQDPQTNDWMHYWTVAISDEHFNYTKQWEWDQSIWMIPDDWWEDVKFTIASSQDIVHESAVVTEENATRTVIVATPKTWPSSHLVGIIIATIVIFGWYIFIKKQADL